MTRIIDLSVAISEQGSEPIPTRIKYYSHTRGATVLALATILEGRAGVRSALRLLPKLARKRVRKRDFPEGVGLAWEALRVETHHGTHIDAPWHYGPTSEGRPARTVDQLPLEWFLGPGVRLDFREKPAGSTITTADLEQALAGIGHELRPMEMVLLWTGADKLWQRPDYLERYCGLDAEATRWLLGKGVKVIGTDAWSVDRPATYMGRDFVATGDPSHLWPAHFVGREREYCQIEKLAHLGDLPGPTGYTVICFPVSIERASAGWTRAVAVVPDDGDELG